MGTLIFIVIIVIGIVIWIEYTASKSTNGSTGTNFLSEEENKQEKYKMINQIPNNSKIVFLQEFDGKEYFEQNSYIAKDKTTYSNEFYKTITGEGICKMIWVEENYLKMCKLYEMAEDPNTKVDKITIPIDNIVFFAREGDYRIDNIIEGGGVSLGGAIVGGVIAGGAGAILGGRKKITTTQKEVDERKTYLYYTEGNVNKQVVFSNNDYKTLIKILPKKDIEYIEKNQRINDIKNDANVPENNVYKDIEELAKLKDKGILTEEEFTEKKKVLLAKIQ